ncbi:MAG: RIO1 family regulatory kinase/ATPase [Candidatus Diapherotrites archaeon]|nr:RIO1 family regulatory kinase/ATPase [Candidatus Diapherotrites archaeon]
MGKLNQSTEFLPFQLIVFLQEKNLTLVKPLAKGWSSWIYLVKNKKNQEIVLKVERSDSPRNQMCLREFENLKLANTIGIGPKVIGLDLEKKIIQMEYISGVTFDVWILDEKHSKKEIQEVVEKLLKQAQALDTLKLDHGQLGGKARNIIVQKKGKKFAPIIIDFEKASTKRKTHNLNQLKAFLFQNPKGAIAKKIKELGDDWY